MILFHSGQNFHAPIETAALSSFAYSRGSSQRFGRDWAPGCRMIGDSGAFSLIGGKAPPWLTMEAFTAWALAHPSIGVFFSFDDPRSFEAARENMREHERLMRAGGGKYFAPVVKIEYMARADYALIIEDAARFPFVGLGGFVRYARQKRGAELAAKVFRDLKSANPRVRVHGLGVGRQNWKIAPFYSADSSAVLTAVLSGRALTPASFIAGARRLEHDAALVSEAWRRAGETVVDDFSAERFLLEFTGGRVG